MIKAIDKKELQNIKSIDINAKNKDLIIIILIYKQKQEKSKTTKIFNKNERSTTKNIWPYNICSTIKNQFLPIFSYDNKIQKNPFRL